MRRHPAQKRSLPVSHDPTRLAAGEVSSYSQRVYVQAFLIFLEERRALYAPSVRLREGDAIISVQKIVDESEWCLQQFEDQSPGALLLQKIANACRYFVAQSAFSSSAEFYMTLGALRLFIADMIAKLSLAYDVSGTLPKIGIMPAQEDNAVHHPIEARR